ncbi:MAG: CHAT domain-containing protein [Leptolyngbyaceae cyanobacterium RU_5_1]|nr:CHAT domain-containing protein [Leptolyngbyaceae cyanobacterium RU_5_1]
MILFLFTVAACGLVPSVITSVRATVPAAGIVAQNSLTEAQRLEQQGRSRYDAGQFSEAAEAFRQAAQAYQTQGNTLQQALSLSNLSLSYQQLGKWTEAAQAIRESLSQLQVKSGMASSADRVSAFAQALDIQGNLQLAHGQADQALATWEKVTAIYQQLDDRDRTLESRINQAQALQTMGLYRRAIALLNDTLGLESSAIATPERLKTKLTTLPTTSTTAIALQSLGEALRVTGNLEPSQTILRHSLKIAEQRRLPEIIAAAQFKLGNTLRAQALAYLGRNNMTLPVAVELIKQSKAGRRFQGTAIALAFDQQMNNALTLYQSAISTATATNTRTQAQLNQFSLLVDTQQDTKLVALLPQLQQHLSQLPASHNAIYARINLAQSLMKWKAENGGRRTEKSSALAIAHLLSTAAQQSKELHNPRAQSYALGSLGRLYEHAGQWQDAQTVTQRALWLAQSVQAADIAYLWQWQLGRLLQVQVQPQAAIAAYQEAVNTLKSVRKELITTTPEEQFSFRDAIEPIHRELVALLLEPQGTTPNPENLKAARNVIESLQLTELVNFFREDCLTSKPEQIDQVDPSSAVFYPIILPNQLAVIVSLPGQSLTYYATPATVTNEQIEAIANKLQRSLNQSNIPESEFLPPAQQLYDWLIRPVTAELKKRHVKTLVFVLDGVLRNIPMAALHDRTQNQYLVEQYSIALTPGLQLLGSQPLPKKRLSALVAGLTEARSGFPALPNVVTELQQVQSQVPNSRVLLDQQFTDQSLQTDFRTLPVPIVHFATHGQFSSQLENTFILTWNSQLNIDQLRNLLQLQLNPKDPLELLVLSACETAAGDNRAALGLAGMAVRAGARSTIATLWQVNDVSSAALMGQLYRGLNQPQTTKAEALRLAQLSLFKNSQSSDYQHPYYWAPYVLIGNWQ